MQLENGDKLRKSLIVGINYYEKISHLYGCVNDAYSLKSVLERHSDGTLNFGIKLLVGTGPNELVNRKSLKDQLIELFRDDSEIALFYFAGHGYIENSSGYLITSECESGDDGLSLDEVLKIANESKAKNKIIILDSCHSGIAGNPSSLSDASLLTEGMTILTASSDYQYASEEDGQGIFTCLLVDALNGSAANLVGDITPGSIYAHIDQSLGPWDQRPLFKTNVKTFTSLRKVQPPILLSDLRKITELFDLPNLELQLDPSFEPTAELKNQNNEDKFAILQKFNRINLVIPVGEDHMYYAAINSKSCKLTVLGIHYWNLIKKDKL